MNSLSHVLAGLVVYGYVTEKYGAWLDRVNFLEGNTSPDYSLSFLRPHRMRYCKDMVKRKTGRICRLEWQDENWQLSKRLGVLCHYYSDFSRPAHSFEFSGILPEHIQYEQDLLLYMGNHMECSKGLDYVSEIEAPLTVQEIYKHMYDRVYQKYEFGQDFETGLFFVIRSCTKLVPYVFHRGRCVAKPAVQ